MQEHRQSLGSLIVDTMRLKGISIEKLAAMTGISDRVLNGLVEESFETLPPAPYVRGYLLKIAEVLNLEGESLWGEYLKDSEAVRRSGASDALPHNRFEGRKIQKKVVWVVLIIILLGGYLVARLISFFQKPDFEITNIPNGGIVREATIVVRGVVEENARLTLAEDAIYPQKDGVFEKAVTLEPGVNVLTFKVGKILGKKFEIMHRIIYEPSPPNQELPASTTTLNGIDL